MTQVAIPTATTSNTFTVVGVPPSRPHQAVDEGIGSADDDTSYVESTTTGLTCNLSLGTLSDPDTDEGHKIHIRYRSVAAVLFPPAEFDVEILQGATVAAVRSIELDSVSYQDQVLTLTEAEVAALTDYTDLGIRVRNTPAQTFRVTVLEFEVPDAGSGSIARFGSRVGSSPAPLRQRVRARAKLSFGANEEPLHHVQQIRTARPVPPLRAWLRARANLRFGQGAPPAPEPAPRPLVGPRVARPVYPDPSVISARHFRARRILEDPLPPAAAPRPLVGPRVSRPIYPDPSTISGRAVYLRRTLVPDPPTLPVPIGVISIRTAKAPPPHSSWVSGRVVRTGPPVRFVLVSREVSLQADLDILTTETYRVILRNVETGVETTLGTGTFFDDVAIADGKYSIRVEADGRYWRGARFAREYPLTIEGGEIVAPLPEILNLAAQTSGTSVLVTWGVELLDGAATPEDFGVWVSATSPVDTSGAPDETATYSGPAGYLVDLTASPTLLYVAVAARKGAQVGPVSEVAVSGVESTLTGPGGQSARIPDGDWET